MTLLARRDKTQHRALDKHVEFRPGELLDIGDDADFRLVTTVLWETVDARLRWLEAHLADAEQDEPVSDSATEIEWPATPGPRTTFTLETAPSDSQTVLQNALQSRWYQSCASVERFLGDIASADGAHTWKISAAYELSDSYLTGDLHHTLRPVMVWRVQTAKDITELRRELERPFAVGLLRGAAPLDTKITITIEPSDIA